MDEPENKMENMDNDELFAYFMDTTAVNSIILPKEEMPKCDTNNVQSWNNHNSQKLSPRELNNIILRLLEGNLSSAVLPTVDNNAHM
jgi:hypothetical protein